MKPKPKRHYVDAAWARRTLCGLDCEALMAGVTTDKTEVTCTNCRRRLGIDEAGCTSVRLRDIADNLEELL